MKNKVYDSRQAEVDALQREEQKLLRRSKGRRAARVLDRIFGFLLATAVLACLGALAAGYVIFKGPSPDLKETFAMTMLESRRFGFIPNIYLAQAEVDELQAKRRQNTELFFDPSLIQLNSRQEETTEVTETVPDNPYGDYDEDGDGIILEHVTGNGYIGYMIKILDPKRVFVSKGGSIYPLAEQCQAHGALGGINGGAFVDENGAGNGDWPDGLTIVDGQIVNIGYDSNCFAGLTQEGLLVVGWYNAYDAQNLGIVGGVTFGPILISNGVPVDISTISSGLNPRTAIGQRKDGAILMLVIDGRQVHSYGATYRDVQNVMLEYGAVNAINLDGGSSTTMWYNGEYVNSCSSANGIARPIPDAFLFR